MKGGDAMTELGARGTPPAQTADVIWTQRDRLLRSAAVLYGAGLALHTADHIRRGVGVLTPEVIWAGTVSTIAGVVTLRLVLTRHRLAPLLATLIGFQVALGTAAVHLLPHWGSFSDALPGAHGTGVTAFSWIVVIIELVGALLLGIFGANLLFLQRQTDLREPLAANPRERRPIAEGAE